MRRRLFLPVVSVTMAVLATAGFAGGPAASEPAARHHQRPSQSAARAGSPHRSCDPIAQPQGSNRGEEALRCGLPFPNDYFAMRDRSTDTGLRVALTTDDMPRNKDGVPIDVTEQNRNDGFSPGAALLVDMPDLDLAASGVAPITDIARSLDRDAPIVIVDTDTGRRHPYWAEFDSNATSDSDRLLLVHPATNWIEGHRYVVGFRRVRDHHGRPMAASGDFSQLRDEADGSDANDRSHRDRRPGLREVLRDLRRAGVRRRDVILAWDFTVASERSLSERILHMRDDAFASLGDAAPGFTVTSSEEATDGSLLRTVNGTFEVPRYLTGTGEPGSMLNNGSGTDNPLPTQNGMQTANFVCTVPRSAVGPDGEANPSRMSLYGHGLLGTAGQVRGVGSEYAKVSNTTFCATDWIGLAAGDVPNAVATLQDLSGFRTMADRMQQGILNFLFLGRLMKSPKGLTTDPAFQNAAGAPLLDHENLELVGLSQGGIMGGATTAVAQDWDRALLGVPGANYSLLLNRSVDFDLYGSILNPAYPNAADRQLGLQLIQMLWDRGENNGYSQHFTRDPYPGTHRKQFLLFEAFGDHQVANISTEVLARTMNARLRTPALRDGRSLDVTPFWDIRPVRRLPDDGHSYLTVWDFGTPAPPTTNTPNRAGEDPHGKGRGQLDVLTLGATFLETGQLIDVCNGQPCVTLDL